MQRYSRLSLIFIGMLFLAACGGTSASTPETTSPTAQAADTTPSPLAATPDFASTLTAEPTIDQQVRSFGTDEPPLPIPGTIIAPTTPDPDAGLIFDLIILERTGGPTSQPLTIEVRSDGAFTRNDVPGTLSPDQITLIDTIIDQLNFFGLQGVFIAPGTSADTFRYRVTVERAGASRTLQAADGFLPPELAQFLSLLGSLGEPTQ